MSLHRAQLRHVLLDVGFKDKPKLIDLEGEFGPLSRLFFIDLLAAMSAATNARISRGAAKILGQRIGLAHDASERILGWCLEREMLSLEDGLLTNVRVIADQESFYQRTRENEEEAERKKVEYWRRKLTALGYAVEKRSGDSGTSPSETPARASRRLRKQHVGDSGTSPSETPAEIERRFPAKASESLDTVYVDDLDLDLKEGGVGETHDQPAPGPLWKSCRYVRLGEIEYEALAMQYRSEGLEPKWCDWAIAKVDRWMTGGRTSAAVDSRALRSHFLSLTDWPLEEAKKARAQDAENARKLTGPTKPAAASITPTAAQKRAWSLVCQVADDRQHADEEEALAHLPEDVRAAVRQLDWHRLKWSTGSSELRNKFYELYPSRAGQ